MSNVFIEAIIVGLVVIVLGYIIGLITEPFLGVALPDACNSWNKKYVMEINLFLIGFTAHLLFEYLGANKWYCRYGNACKMNSI